VARPIPLDAPVTMKAEPVRSACVDESMFGTFLD
jgi:hypothetical protein